MASLRHRLREWVVAGSMAGSLALLGCGPGTPADAPKVAGSASNGGTAPVDNAGNGTNPEPVAASVNFNQLFDDAVITDVIAGQHFPPNVTAGGKKTGALRAAVEELWPKIKLTNGNGSPIGYAVTLNTAEGPIEIRLRPEIAPNHVRNFLALVHLGYYDGLSFERVVHQEADVDGVKSRLDVVLAGCPTGTGDDGCGHIGYFMHPEFQQVFKHVEGTVGFWHEEKPYSAGTRFYITLGPAPTFDGQYTVIGSVSKGLDAVKKIAAAPRQSPDVYPDSEKPVNPVAIQKATVAPEIVEK